ncbi:MAG: carbohydrate kinase family protein [Cyclobacteriaceae bacterium]
MYKMLAFGEVLWDMIEGEAHLGGAPLNFAAHVKKCGLSSGIVSCIGNDTLGERAFDAVGSLGVNTGLILRRNKKTGIVRVDLKDGQPDYEILKPSAYDYIDIGQLDHATIGSYDVFYFGTLAQRADMSRIALYEILAQHHFLQVFYDVNLRKNSYTSGVILESLNHATILKINDEEVSIVSEMIFEEILSFEEFSKQLFRRFSQIHTIIITAGGDGCYILSGGNITKVPSEPVKVVDTVGAGDSFSAAFMSKFMSSNDPVKSAEVANKIGGFVASQSGAIPQYSEELKALFL